MGTLILFTLALALLGALCLAIREANLRDRAAAQFEQTALELKDRDGVYYHALYRVYRALYNRAENGARPADAEARYRLGADVTRALNYKLSFGGTPIPTFDTPPYADDPTPAPWPVQDPALAVACSCRDAKLADVAPSERITTGRKLRVVS